MLLFCSAADEPEEEPPSSPPPVLPFTMEDDDPDLPHSSAPVIALPLPLQRTASKGNAAVSPGVRVCRSWLHEPEAGASQLIKVACVNLDAMPCPRAKSGCGAGAGKLLYSGAPGIY